mmetsp:Transcript_19744/g.31435  ORF Transcript_19744/g.31435 Transcript_19744/m.31435 type:complete len:218 (+) Transcript_19744:52-705(+)
MALFRDHDLSIAAVECLNIAIFVANKQDTIADDMIARRRITAEQQQTVDPRTSRMDLHHRLAFRDIVDINLSVGVANRKYDTETRNIHARCRNIRAIRNTNLCKIFTRILIIIINSINIICFWFFLFFFFFLLIFVCILCLKTIAQTSIQMSSHTSNTIIALNPFFGAHSINTLQCNLLNLVHNKRDNLAMLSTDINTMIIQTHRFPFQNRHAVGYL